MDWLMRVLTVKQPWADLIVAGIKRVENRTWAVPKTLPCQDGGQPPNHTVAEGYAGLCSPFPFRLGIHAAKQSASMVTSAHVAQVLSDSEWRALDALLPGQPWERTGVLLGYVTVTGCHHDDDCGPTDHWLDQPCETRWTQRGDLYHWTLSDPEPLGQPIPMKGRLGLWKIDVPVPA